MLFSFLIHLVNKISKSFAIAGLFVFCSFSTSVASSNTAIRTPMALTISGGVSLGAYESGFLYLLNRQIVQSRKYNLKIVTGASAGAINGVVSILNNCRPLTDDVQSSINWKIWTGLGIDQLTDIKKVTSTSLFSRDGLTEYTDQIRNEFLDGLSSDCDLVLGIAVTRKKPKSQEIRPGLISHRHQEFFAIRIKGRGLGKPPEIENFPIGKSGTYQLYLPFNKSSENNYKLLESVFTASAQFPIAFAPLELSFCDFESIEPTSKCKDQFIEKADFIDGGLYDNTPADIAYNISQKFLTKNENKKIIYNIITLSDQAVYREDASSETSDSMVSYVAKIFSDFVSTSRNDGLSRFLLKDKSIVNRTYSNSAILVKTSKYYYAFSGFVDKGFREYDFYAGMFDAKYFLESTFIKKKQDLSSLKSVSSWQKLFCFEDLYLSKIQNSSACEAAFNNKGFQILTNVNYELTVESCKNHALNKKFIVCELLGIENKPQTDTDSSTKQEAKPESEYSFFSRRLAEENYPFENQAYPNENLSDVIRRKLQPTIKHLIGSQKGSDLLIENETNIILDSLSFKPPDSKTLFGLGSHFQYTRNFLINQSAEGPWHLYGYGAMLIGLPSYFTSAQDIASVAPFVSYKLNWTNPQNFWYQPELAIRLGYNKPLQSLPEICEGRNVYAPSYGCESPFIQQAIGVTFLNVINLEFGIMSYAKDKLHDELTFLIQFQTLKLD